MGRLAGKAHSKIEELPEVERKKVVDALLEGKSLRAVAKLAGISHVQVAMYKQRVMLPAIRTAQKVHAVQQLDSPDKPTSVRVAERVNLTKEIVQSSPFRERLEKLWNRVDRSLDKAENAVRTRMVDGVEVWEEQGLQAIAPLMNQAHKNLELLGRVTGEIEQSAAANFAIQIVLPGAPSCGPSGPVIEATAEPQTIDVALLKR